MSHHSKAKRDFLIAAQGNPDWYQAVPAHALSNKTGMPAALHLEAPLKDAFTLTAWRKYDLLRIAAEASAGVRADVIAALAPQILKDVPGLVALQEERAASECAFRSDNRTLDTMDKMQELCGDDEEKYWNMLEDLTYLRSLPNDAFERPEFVAEMSSLTGQIDSILAAAQALNQADAEKQASIETILGTMTGKNLVDLAYSCGFDFGDRFNRIDIMIDGGMSPEDVKARFDVPKTIMKHWDELGTSNKGRPYDAFMAGEGNQKRVYIKSSFVAQKLKAL